MWILINVVLIVIGALIISNAYSADSFENYDAFFDFVVGAIVLIVGVVSSFIKWIWF